MQCIPSVLLLFAFAVMRVDTISPSKPHVTVKCLENGVLISVESNNMRRGVKGPTKLILNDGRSGSNGAACEMKISNSQTVSLLAPESCLSNSTLQKVSLIIDNQTIYELEFSCGQWPEEVVLIAEQDGEPIKINSSVQIGFDLNLIALSQYLPFQIVDCWTEHYNNRAIFLKNGVPLKDFRGEPLCQLYDGTVKSNYGFSNYDPDSPDADSHDFKSRKQKFWQIRVRLGWDALPDSRQKELQQLLRTKPQLQWEAVPGLSLDYGDFLSQITIYPVTIQCSVSPSLPNRTLTISSIGPIGVFIPQFYFLENILFSCCPVETTIAYAKLLEHAAQKRILSWKVSNVIALLVSLTAFGMAVCCSLLALPRRYRS